MIQISTQLEVVVKDGKEKVLKINFTGGWGWLDAGSSGNKANSAFNWAEVEVEDELGKRSVTPSIPFMAPRCPSIFILTVQTNFYK